MARKKFKVSGRLFGVGGFGGIHGNRCLQEFNPCTTFKFDDEGIVFNLSHATIGTADGNNEIPFLYFLDKYFLVFGFFLLRTNHEEVEHSYDGANKDHLLYDAVLGL